MKLIQAIRKSTEVGIALSGIAVLILAGCGGGGASASGTGAATTFSAASFLKSAPGNHWTLSGTAMQINLDTNGFVTSISVMPTTITTTVLSVANGVALMSTAAVASGIPPSSSQGTRYIDTTTGNLMNVASGVGAVPSIALPGTFTVGTTWTRSPATATASAVPATITAINVTRTVPAGTFNDCVQVTSGPSLTYNGSATVTSTQYHSPSVGYLVETSSSITTSNATYTSGIKLDAGFVANSY